MKQGLIPKILQNAIFSLLLFARNPFLKTRNRACYYSLLKRACAQKSSRLKPSILKNLGYILILLLVAMPLYADSLYPLNNARQEAQFHYLLKELRCLVCQNQDLADSNADLAKDLRQQVYEFVQQGKGDQEIITYLTARYGDFILFNPPVKLVTLLLWFGPLAFLLLGLVIFWRGCFSKGAS